MKLASYLSGNTAGYGVVTGKGMVDLTRWLGTRYADLRAMLAAHAVSGYQLADLTLPVIPNPDRIICMDPNHEAHRGGSGRNKTENPALFIRVANAQLGDNPRLLPLWIGPAIRLKLKLKLTRSAFPEAP